MANKRFSWLRIINTILLAAVFILCLVTCTKINDAQTAGSTDSMVWIRLLTDLITVATGLMYLFFGYRKRAALYFKLFMGFFALSQALLLSDLLADPMAQPFYFGIVYLLSFAAVLILSFGKDLGKGISLTLIGMLVIGGAVVLVMTLFLLDDFAPSAFEAVTRGVTNFLLAVTAGSMVLAKYLDKAERGSK